MPCRPPLPCGPWRTPLGAGAECTVHVLGVGLDKGSRERIVASVPPTTSLVWYEFDREAIADLPLASLRDVPWINETAYTLLFFDRYLPPEVRSVLFLDADIVVRRSPRTAMELPLGGRAIAAARDLTCPAVSLHDGVVGWRELSLDGRLPYFNSGVLVLDRDVWRERGLEASCLQYLERFRDRINYVDQDALNAAVAGEWLELPPAWNYQANLESEFADGRSHAYAFVDTDELDAARRDPAIVHFAGELKPWHWGGASLPFAEEWAATLDRTAWAGVRPQPPPELALWRRATRRARRGLCRRLCEV